MSAAGAVRAAGAARPSPRSEAGVLAGSSARRLASGGETDDHLMFKAALASAARATGADAAEEFSGGGWRSDVMASWPDRRRACALEVQTSPQPMHVTRRRQRLYSASGLSCVWFFSPPALDALGQSTAALPVMGLRWGRSGGAGMGAEVMLPAPSLLARAAPRTRPRRRRAGRPGTDGPCGEAPGAAEAGAGRARAPTPAARPALPVGVAPGSAGRPAVPSVAWSYSRSVPAESFLRGLATGDLRWSPRLAAAPGPQSVSAVLAWARDGAACPRCGAAAAVAIACGPRVSAGGTPLPAAAEWGDGAAYDDGASAARALGAGPWGCPGLLGRLRRAAGDRGAELAVPRLQGSGKGGQVTWGLGCGRCGAAMPAPAAAAATSPAFAVRDPFGDMTARPAVSATLASSIVGSSLPLAPLGWSASPAAAWHLASVSVALPPEGDALPDHGLRACLGDGMALAAEAGARELRRAVGVGMWELWPVHSTGG